MNAARQLYRLQEIDTELASREQARAGVKARIGESEEVLRTARGLEQEKKQLEETTHRQHTIEWEIDDISTKTAKFEEELYSGRTTSPKELTGLQQEIEALKTKRSSLEDQALELMETVEELNNNISALETQLHQLEVDWREQQKHLVAELAELETEITGLKEKRDRTTAEIDPGLVELYSEIKKQRGTGVAKVEQGICRGCRISLPVNELQQVRSGGMVRCSSCGRILFLA